MQNDDVQLPDSGTALALTARKKVATDDGRDDLSQTGQLYIERAATANLPFAESID